MKAERVFEWSDTSGRFRILQMGHSHPGYGDAYAIEKCETDLLGGERWVEVWRWAKEGRSAYSEGEGKPVELRAIIALLGKVKAS